jgi:hypothetical protein
MHVSTAWCLAMWLPILVAVVGIATAACVVLS